MLPITKTQCGDLLAMWLEKTCAPKDAKLIAKEVGFNDTPFFGAQKKKIKLMGELVMVNTALVIFAVNQVFDATDSKSIIDSFLSVAKKSIFSVIEKKDSDFKNRYEQRLSEYIHIFEEDRPALGLSFTFIKNLGLDPLSNMQGQILVATRFTANLAGTRNVLSNMTIQPQNLLQEFECEIKSWPEEQAKAALLLIEAIFNENSAMFGPLSSKLSGLAYHLSPPLKG